MQFNRRNVKWVAPRDNPISRRHSFTDTRMGRLEVPETGRNTYSDSGLRGLQVRVYPNGRKTFSLYLKVKGSPQRTTIGEWPDIDVKKARELAQKLRTEIAGGRNPAEERAAKRAELTFGELFAIFMENYSRKEKRTWIQDQRKYNAYLCHLADRKLSSITTDELSKLNDKIGTDSPYMANRVLELVAVMFNFARGEIRRKGKARKFPALWTGANPATGISSFEEHKRRRFIDSDELPRFFAALATATSVIRDYVLTSLLTAGRQGNVLSMQWSEIRWQRMVWEVPPEKSKNGKPMDIVLVPAVIEILERRKNAPDAHPRWVFPSPTQSKSGHLSGPWTSFHKVLRRAGLKDIRLHDLRRSLASWAAMQGTSLLIIGKMLGHEDSAPTEIYARLQSDAIRAAVTNATDAMLKLMPTANTKPN